MAAPTHTYQGNPGYVVNLEAGITVLEPGAQVALTADEAAAFGGDVAPLDLLLADRKVSELRQYAADNDIDLGDATKKADVLAVIEAALLDSLIVDDGSDNTDQGDEPDTEGAKP